MHGLKEIDRDLGSYPHINMEPFQYMLTELEKILLTHVSITNMSQEKKF